MLCLARANSAFREGWAGGTEKAHSFSISLMPGSEAVHVGEWGCYNKTPHDVALAWMRDLLSLWQEVGWGHAMWNLKGDFGVLNSRRADVKYENFKGHQLDRKMLELVREFNAVA